MFEIRIQAPKDHLDQLQDRLQLLGAVAISLTDSQDHPIYEPKPDEIILWDHTTLIAYFEEDYLKNAISAYLNALVDEKFIESFTADTVENKDWVRECLDQFTPMQFGKRLWIVPSWHKAPDNDAINILLDPGLAFGTGTHPTTRLCLEWLDENIKPHQTIIDYGCGSGILCIAALKLGAQKAYAVDHEEQALIATRTNAEQNHIVDEALLLSLPNNFNAEPADILIANILAKPIIEFAEKFAALVKPNGHIVLSGIFKNQSADVLAAYEPYFLLSPPTELNDWVRIDGVKR